MSDQFLPYSHCQNNVQCLQAILGCPTKIAAEAILEDHGLHKIIVSFSIVPSRNKFHLNLSKNAFWSIANSDPYRVVSYDTLHSDDIGKWEASLATQA